MFLNISLFILSLVVVAFGQEDFIAPLSPLAALFGFALFWKTLFFFDEPKKRFFYASFWFFLVSLIKLAWLTSTEFVGSWILIFYLLASLLVGIQFGFTSLLVRPKMSALRTLMIASVWTLLEYSRLFIFSGYVWNPVGLALSAYTPSLQVASLVGIYGLSFLVIFTNLLFLQWQKWGVLLVVAAFPYLFGIVHIYYQEDQAKENKEFLQALLVQTAILQDERLHLGEASKVLSPLQQWQKVLSLLKPYSASSVDLVVLPEGVIPYPAYHPIYSHLDIINLFYTTFGRNALKDLPPLKEPMAMWIDQEKGKKGFWAVGNAYIAQSLSNYFKADVLAGFEAVEADENKKNLGYQSMFHFQKDRLTQSRYDKRALIPVGEYIPFSWCESVANCFGVNAFFTPGSKAKVFEGKVPIGACICYEEMNGGLMSESKRLGAKCLVNITNDGWYPGGLLPKQHFIHAKPRTVEAGIPLLRACTTGVTGAIDSLGRTIKILNIDEPHQAAALLVNIPLFHYSTLYERTGNSLILTFSITWVALFLLLKKRGKSIL